MSSNVTQEANYFDQLHAEKYRDEGQSKRQHQSMMSINLGSHEHHIYELIQILKDERFLPAGRVQAALGAKDREVSAFNCSVSQPIKDNMDSIMDGVKNAAKILRLGTGIGFNFSHIRPQFDPIVKLKTKSSGPLSFMSIYNETAKIIASAGHRRGAMMAIMNVDHPDIFKFIDAKLAKGVYECFNFSVGITKKFMEAVEQDLDWDLKFKEKIYQTIKARELWDKIMLNAYNSAEPGVVFLDRMNEYNNLWYCEKIEATNPCSEQPLPPYGLCLLGSFNLIKYFTNKGFNNELLKEDVYTIVEAYDNIFNNAIYAIPEHKTEALNKRRIGIGYTGISNAIEYYLRTPSYGETLFCEILDNACRLLTIYAYEASIELAKRRGPFPLFNRDKYIQSKFIQTLPKNLQESIYKYGIRNSHLISYAPCGTISQAAGNISSGVEPIFYHAVDRQVYMKDGLIKVTLQDYMYREHGFKGKTLEDCTLQDHLNVMEVIQRHTDSAVSKTINVPSSISFEDYKQVYLDAYKLGAKGITVFRPTELRGAVITSAKKGDDNPVEPRVSNCKDGVCVM
jgi:ribonucleoside-diphosphate reductase alpha chain